MGTKCPSAASPGDPLVTFPSLGKSLAVRRRRNPPHMKKEGRRGQAPALQKERKPSRRRNSFAETTETAHPTKRTKAAGDGKFPCIQENI